MLVTGRYWSLVFRSPGILVSSQWQSRSQQESIRLLGLAARSWLLVRNSRRSRRRNPMINTFISGSLWIPLRIFILVQPRTNNKIEPAGPVIKIRRAVPCWALETKTRKHIQGSRRNLAQESNAFPNSIGKPRIPEMQLDSMASQRKEIKD